MDRDVPHQANFQTKICVIPNQIIINKKVIRKKIGYQTARNLFLDFYFKLTNRINLNPRILSRVRGEGIT